MADTTYTVTAPLVIAKNAEGGDVYVYQGGTVPQGQSKEWVESHIESKMIEEGAAAEPEGMKAGDDPADFSVAQVQAYLATADDDEKDRVLEAEAAGKKRATLLG